jgi:hypothetical protein
MGYPIRKVERGANKPRFAVRFSRTKAGVGYAMFRWLAPRLPSRRSRDWAWGWKWRLWHSLYGPHVHLWAFDT